MHFDDNDFRDELITNLSSSNVEFYYLAQFTNVSKNILEKKAPLNERYVSDIT